MVRPHCVQVLMTAGIGSVERLEVRVRAGNECVRDAAAEATLHADHRHAAQHRAIARQRTARRRLSPLTDLEENPVDLTLRRVVELGPTEARGDLPGHRLEETSEHDQPELEGFRGTRARSNLAAAHNER
jgi:hypothetical protein